MAGVKVYIVKNSKKTDDYTCIIYVEFIYPTFIIYAAIFNSPKFPMLIPEGHWFKINEYEKHDN